MMWLGILLTLGCREEEPVLPEPTEEPSETGVPTTDTDTDAPDDTGFTTDTGAPTGTGTAVDFLLPGDPADLIGVVELQWYPEVEPGRWAVMGLSFEEGSYAYSGPVVQPYAGPDSCEVRPAGAELQVDLANLGAIDLLSDGGVHVWMTSPTAGSYQGQEEMSEVDPRGLTWDFLVEGDAYPGGRIDDALVFPAGTLGVEAPASGAEVPRGSPLTVSWSGPAADQVEIVLFQSAGPMIRCLATDDGQVEIDAATLGHLQPGAFDVVVYRAASRVGALGQRWLWLRGVQSVTRSVTALP